MHYVYQIIVLMFILFEYKGKVIFNVMKGFMDAYRN
jgi:hypothetical protein